MIDQQDLKVLKKLRADSRATLTAMSNSLGMPVSTVFEKVKKLRKSVVVKCVDLVDFEKLGFVVRANFMVRTEERKREQLKELVLKHKNVNSVFRTNNGFDFFIETIFSDMKQLNAFCEQLDLLRAKRRMHFVVEELKRECFHPYPE
jgi:DNA-binding Lrp family transcriptional regulator